MTFYTILAITFDTCMAATWKWYHIVGLITSNLILMVSMATKKIGCHGNHKTSKISIYGIFGIATMYFCLKLHSMEVNFAQVYYLSIMYVHRQEIVILCCQSHDQRSFSISF